MEVWDLIEFNFETRKPEEVNWYLKELVGCRVSTDGLNYAFKGADPKKGKIYRPMAKIPDEPLPENKNFDQKLQDLWAEAMNWKKNGRDPRLPRYECMFYALQQGYDDRIIQWINIAPDNQTPVAFGVQRQDRFYSASALDPQWFHDHIRSATDVDQQPSFSGVGGGGAGLFVTSVRLFIEKFQPSLLTFRSLHDEIIATHKNLDLMASAGTFGGAFGGNTSMPPEYQAVRSWILRQENDPKSILNCVTAAGALGS
jgi:hypothetical protein